MEEIVDSEQEGVKHGQGNKDERKEPLHRIKENKSLKWELKKKEKALTSIKCLKQDKPDPDLS